MSETATREPRADKVAVVAEIAGKLRDSQAVFVSEYRGLSVGQLASVRNALRRNDAEHVVYKNTLARLAVREVGLEGLEELAVWAVDHCPVSNAMRRGVPGHVEVSGR